LKSGLEDIAVRKYIGRVLGHFNLRVITLGPCASMILREIEIYRRLSGKIAADVHKQIFRSGGFTQ
jgi:hypothetical protein